MLHYNQRKVIKLKCMAYRKIYKPKPYSLYVNVTEQLKDLGMKDDDKVFVYVEGDKIIIEKVKS